MVLLGWSATHIPRLVERIGAGVSPGWESASYHLSAGAARAAALMPVKVARRYVGV
jgi:hypothetical protein